MLTDVRGNGPTALELKYFTEDKDPKKREKLLDTLLKDQAVQKKLGDAWKAKMLGPQTMTYKRAGQPPCSSFGLRPGLGEIAGGDEIHRARRRRGHAMKAMKAGDLRTRTADELTDQAETLGKEIFNLRFQRATGQLENTSRVREVRRDIARLKTVAKTKRSGAPKK